MNNTEWALIAYLAWFLSLLIAIELYRAILIFTSNRLANEFSPDGKGVSPLMNRLVRAHANCYESFPFIGGILLYALATDQNEVTDGLALWLLFFRLAQSLTHLISDSERFSLIRFVFFSLQLSIVISWIFTLVTR